MKLYTYRGLFIISNLFFVVVGFLVAVYIFAIDVEMFALPYKSEVKRTTKSITLDCGDVEFSVPPGVEMIYQRNGKGYKLFYLRISEIEMSSHSHGTWYVDVEKEKMPNCHICGVD